MFFRRLFRALRDAYLRATKGWCPSDVWNWDSWFGSVVPEMLRYLADYSHTYPGNNEFDTPEKWIDWLRSVADVIEYAVSDDNDENEYRVLFHQAMNSVGISTLDKMEIKYKYLKREEEIDFNKQLSIEDAMSQIGKNFFQLWD